MSVEARPTKHRGSVLRDVKEFCGWDYLLSLMQKIKERDAKRDWQDRAWLHDCITLRDQALIASIFETGGRINEVLALTYSNFDLTSSEGFIIIKNMPVSKQKSSKLGSAASRRSFPVRRHEPLVRYIEEYLKQYANKPKVRIFGLNRRRAHQIVKELDPKIYPHWLRSQRACQLAYDYGFTMSDLMEFFGWKRVETAMIYARLGWKGLARRMEGAMITNNSRYEKVENNAKVNT